MGSTERWIIEQNFGRFLDYLEREEGAGNCLVVSRLLLDEEDKIARFAGHLDKLDNHIERCEALIARLRTKIDGRESAERKEFAETLGNLAQIRDALLAVRGGARRDLDKLDGP